MQGVTSTSWRKWSEHEQNHTVALNGSCQLNPRAPNSGGLREPAVRSKKHHLRRVMSRSILTYEEMTTILCEIDQVLKIRPLMALTDNPDDIFALTPTRLVNGRRLYAIPQPCLQKIDVRGHPINLFRSLQQLLSQFWKRCFSEYVASL